MEENSLVQLLEENEDKDISVTRHRFVARIAGIFTDVIFNRYEHHSFILAKQEVGERIGFYIKVANFPEPVPRYKIKQLSGRQEYMPIAYFIAKKMHLEKSLFLGLRLINYETETLNAFVEGILEQSTTNHD